MSDLSTFAERNAAFTADFPFGDLQVKPRFSTIILTCVDARVDPAYFFGLEPGDALVLRTAGGRATKTALREVAILWNLMKFASGNTPELDLMIIHHTNCGMARFATPAGAAFITEAFDDSSVVSTYGITDLESSTAMDVQRAMDSDLIPTGMNVSAHIYDVASGAVQEAVPPRTK